jgi:hypothetical protein
MQSFVRIHAFDNTRALLAIIVTVTFAVGRLMITSSFASRNGTGTPIRRSIPIAARIRIPRDGGSVGECARKEKEEY